MDALHKDQILELDIVDAAFGGKGVAKLPTEQGDYILFVPNAIVGQKVRAKIAKKKKRWAECELLEVIERSPDEQAIPYQQTDGAPFATLPIAIQQQQKKKQALELYRRIGLVENIEDAFDEYIESPEIWHYRNKMEYFFSQPFSLGLKKRGSWVDVQNVERSTGLFDKQLEDALPQIREYCQATGLPAWDLSKGKGFFRYLVVRKSFATDQLLIKLVVSSAGLQGFDRQAFVQELQELFGNRLAGVLLTVNDDPKDGPQSRLGQEQLLYGTDTITEQLLDLKFDIGMQSFFQTNPRCAELLYAKVIEYVAQDNQPEAEGVILDLFCGTGTIGQLIAARTNATVIGVDIVPQAIANAKQSAAKNKIENIKFVAADVGKFLKQHTQYAIKIGTIVLDPPRAGIEQKTLESIIALGAQRIVYVSCNPSTQARDISTLQQAGYNLSKLSLVDQFPHTAHVEAVALFVS